MVTAVRYDDNDARRHNRGQPTEQRGAENTFGTHRYVREIDNRGPNDLEPEVEPESHNDGEHSRDSSSSIVYSNRDDDSDSSSSNADSSDSDGDDDSYDDRDGGNDEHIGDMGNEILAANTVQNTGEVEGANEDDSDSIFFQSDSSEYEPDSDSEDSAGNKGKTTGEGAIETRRDSGGNTGDGNPVSVIDLISSDSDHKIEDDGNLDDQISNESKRTTAGEGTGGGSGDGVKEDSDREDSDYVPYCQEWDADDWKEEWEESCSGNSGQYSGYESSVMRTDNSVAGRTKIDQDNGNMARGNYKRNATQNDQEDNDESPPEKRHKPDMNKNNEKKTLKQPPPGNRHKQEMSNNDTKQTLKKACEMCSKKRRACRGGVPGKIPCNVCRDLGVECVHKLRKKPGRKSNIGTDGDTKMPANPVCEKCSQPCRECAGKRVLATDPPTGAADSEQNRQDQIPSGQETNGANDERDTGIHDEGSDYLDQPGRMQYLNEPEFRGGIMYRGGLKSPQVRNKLVLEDGTPKYVWTDAEAGTLDRAGYPVRRNLFVTPGDDDENERTKKKRSKKHKKRNSRGSGGGGDGNQNK